jgi:hypothetical protein
MTSTISPMQRKGAKMRAMLFLMLTAGALLTGCVKPSEGRATAILDAAAPYVVPTGQALAGEDMVGAQENGARLLAVLCQWKDTCQ